MQHLYVSLIRNHLSKQGIYLRLIRLKNTTPVVPKVAQDMKEAAKEHVRELRREFDKPIKFSTSRAKHWDTADSIVFNRHIGKFTRPVLIAAVLVNMVCFFFEKKNSIDQLILF